MANRKICQWTLEDHFKVPFKKSSINGLSIDFYNRELMIGVVYYSVHHLKYSSKVHKIHRKFRETQERDQRRKEAAKKAGITLITIPYNTMCVAGSIRRKLKIPNDCRCFRCFGCYR